jgi:ubiquilin
MFAPPPAGAGAGAAAGNPLAMDPAAMQQMLSMMGGMGGGGMGGMGGETPALADTRPPEERFQVQLQVSFGFLCASISLSGIWRWLRSV